MHPRVAIAPGLPYQKAMNDKVHITAANDEGLRLDALVARLTGTGIRAAKRRIAEGAVTVDGKTAPPHYKVVAGAAVALAAQKPVCPDGIAEGIRLLAVRGGFAFFNKPAGVHSAHIKGGGAPSLEGCITSRWPHIAMATEEEPAFVPAICNPILEGRSTPLFQEPLPETAPKPVNRLDEPTSGIVVAAFSADGAAQFRELEAKGAVAKQYLAVVCGTLPSPVTVMRRLDTDGRKITKVLPENTPDATRHSHITPLGPAAGHIHGVPPDATLVAVTIHRGARHQIRAHMAASGHPILGDAVYGSALSGDALYLHHARITVSGAPEAFTVVCPPPWRLP